MRMFFFFLNGPVFPLQASLFNYEIMQLCIENGMRSFDWLSCIELNKEKFDAALYCKLFDNRAPNDVADKGWPRKISLFYLGNQASGIIK